MDQFRQWTINYHRKEIGLLLNSRDRNRKNDTVSSWLVYLWKETRSTEFVSLESILRSLKSLKIQILYSSRFHEGKSRLVDSAVERRVHAARSPNLCRVARFISGAHAMYPRYLLLSAPLQRGPPLTLSWSSPTQHSSAHLFNIPSLVRYVSKILLPVW